MDYKNISQRDKRAVLAHAVLTKSPGGEITALYGQLGLYLCAPRGRRWLLYNILLAGALGDQ